MDRNIRNIRGAERREEHGAVGFLHRHFRRWRCAGGGGGGGGEWWWEV